jgi:cytochrome c biogenesis protein CcmG/thiol:disulfide interchange protein DsbE
LGRSPTPALFALLALVLASGSVAGAESVETLDFSLPALRGGAPIQLAHYRGKIVYVDVWASWCAPCLRSMPELEALREKFRGQPFEVVAVNVDSDVAAAHAFLDRVGTRYPAAFDRDGLQLRARTLEESDLSGLPVGFLLDGHGTVRLVHRGYSPRQSAFLSEHIETLLAELRVESLPRH